MFTHRFGFRIEHLVFFKLDVANGDDFSVLWDLYAINIATAIADEVADIYPGLGFVSSFVLTCQNLFPNGIGSTTVGVDIRGVWLVY